MNRITTAARLALLTLTLAAGTPGLAPAQTGSGRADDTGGTITTGGTTTAGGTGGMSGSSTRDARPDRGFDWGWLGLLGLAGLIPLFVSRNGRVGDYGSTATRGPSSR